MSCERGSIVELLTFVCTDLVRGRYCRPFLFQFFFSFLFNLKLPIMPFSYFQSPLICLQLIRSNFMGNPFFHASALGLNSSLSSIGIQTYLECSMSSMLTSILLVRQLEFKDLKILFQKLDTSRPILDYSKLPLTFTGQICFGFMA